MDDKPNAGERQRYLPYEWDTDGEPTAWQCRRCPVVVFSLAAVHKCETEQTNPLMLEQAVEVREHVELIKRRQKAAQSSTGTKALLIQTFTEDLPWLIEQAEAHLLAQDRIAKLERDNEAIEDLRAAATQSWAEASNEKLRWQAEWQDAHNCIVHLQQQLTDLTARCEALVAERGRLADALTVLAQEASSLHIPEAIPETFKEYIWMLRAHVQEVAALAATELAPDKPVSRQEQAG